MSNADSQSSPDYTGQPDNGIYQQAYFPESTLTEESNLVDVLKYSEDDLDKFREEAIQEENEKLEHAEQEFLIEKSELQKWFESEVRKIRRNAEQQIQEIENEMNLVRKDTATQTLKLREEIEIKNINIQTISQDTVALQQEVDKLKLEVLEKHSKALVQIDNFSLKRLEHDQYKREYDVASKDYEAVMGSFAELHAQYNELKKVSGQIQSVEDDLMRELKNQEHNLHIWNNRYKNLKEVTDQEIQKANATFASMLKGHEHDKVIAENEKKTIDLQIHSATETLELKRQQNQELNNICHELIGAFKN
ncbi:hypothetical protein LOD99_7005 [Oopsacas minuta]|uniref:Transforming acidic coiled-coil-containing protein C-terminal domain-containing protein n=1 Tax=Oopsacas minuta TaxID=111878 RepID=A0AAV7JIZ8_9METZ|nr:hypothetical protein LOD99_7005 [Oopsacas minuta]